MDENDYNQAISIIKDLYHKAKLVHGDYSEYNIFKTENGLVVFDMGSAVDLRHPNAQEFLKRDINNITRFFNKRGITVEDPDKLFEDIIK
jgi:RIO kinase 1